MSAPQRIDRYLVEGELGRGSFGAVYRARHAVIGREVALKVLHPERTTAPSVLERFLGEARAVAAIGSPHIVQVFDAGMTPDGKAFLAMELLEGEDLAHHLATHGRLPAARAVELAREVCLGLAAAHRAQVIHRDLKPANIFLTRGHDGRAHAKVLDFGISKIVRPEGEELTMTGTMLGTPHYMAPEQLQSSRDVDGRADLYALGTVLYEMLSGALPYDGTTLASLIASKVSDPPKPLWSVAPDAPGPVADVVLRALSWDPAARFATADEMEQALAAAAQRISGGLSAPPRTTPHGMAPVAPSETPGTVSAPPRVARALDTNVDSLPGIVNATQIGVLAPGTTAAPFRRWFLIALGTIAIVSALVIVAVALAGLGLTYLGVRAFEDAPTPESSAPMVPPSGPVPSSGPGPANGVAHANGPASSPAAEPSPPPIHSSPTSTDPIAGSPAASAGAVVLEPGTMRGMDPRFAELLAERATERAARCAPTAGYRETFIVVRMESGGVNAVPHISLGASEATPELTSCIQRAFAFAAADLPGGQGIGEFYVHHR